MEQEIIMDAIVDRITKFGGVRNQKRATKYIANVVKNKGKGGDDKNKARGLTLF